MSRTKHPKRPRGDRFQVTLEYFPDLASDPDAYRLHWRHTYEGPDLKMLLFTLFAHTFKKDATHARANHRK